jgi:hypothetical protein
MVPTAGTRQQVIRMQSLSPRAFKVVVTFIIRKGTLLERTSDWRILPSTLTMDCRLRVNALSLPGSFDVTRRLRFQSKRTENVDRTQE